MELVMAIVPVTLWYSLPIAIFFISGWIKQERLYKKIDSNMKVETAHTSEETAKRLLDENALNVSIDKAEDYTENDYNREKGKIFLSPSTMGQKDCTSIAHTLLAVEHAIHERKTPQSCARTRTLHLIGSLTFWCVFTILAFGLMSSSFKVVIAGYIACLIPWGIHLCIQRGRLQRGKQLIQTLESIGMFSEEELMRIKDIARALVIKY